MLKFGPWSRAAQVASLFIVKRGTPPRQLDKRCTARGVTPLGIRELTTRIGLRFAVTNFAPFYALRRCPSLVIHCYLF